MRAAACAVALAMLALAPSGVTAQQGGTSLAGALYQYLPGRAQAPALAGAKVYIARYPLAKQPQWLGPSVSDGLGRFTFSGILPAQYL
ncbi:MAG TPA: hypothetical protein VGC96_04565, partial [Candidatus Elarobacter sp.]